MTRRPAERRAQRGASESQAAALKTAATREKASTTARPQAVLTRMELSRVRQARQPGELGLAREQRVSQPPEQAALQQPGLRELPEQELWDPQELRQQARVQ